MTGTRDEVDDRLRRAAELSAHLSVDTPRVDMSAEAIDRRLREAAELSAFCLELAQIGMRPARRHDG